MTDLQQSSSNVFEWHISLLGSECSEETGLPPSKAKEAYTSPPFALRGHGPCYLHFMPYVRGSHEGGYGGLYLEAPSGCGMRFVLGLGQWQGEFEGHWTARQQWHGGCLLSSRAEVFRMGAANGFDAYVELIEDLGSLRPFQGQLGGSGIEWVIPQASALVQQAQKGEAIITRHFDLDDVRNLRLRLYPRGDKACPEGSAAVHLEAPVGSKLRYTLTVGHGSMVWTKSTEEVFKKSRIGCAIGSLQPFCSRDGELIIRLESLPWQCTGSVGEVGVMQNPSTSLDEKEVRIEWLIRNARAVMGSLRRGQYVRSETFDAGAEDPWQLVLFPRSNLGCERLPGDEVDVDYACHPGSDLGSLYLHSVRAKGHSPLPSGLKCRWFAGTPDRSVTDWPVDNILVGGIDMEPGRGFEDEEATTLRKSCASHGVHEVCNFFDLIDHDGTLTLGVHISGHLSETAADSHVRAMADRLKGLAFA